MLFYSTHFVNLKKKVWEEGKDVIYKFNGRLQPPTEIGDKGVANRDGVVR